MPSRAVTQTPETHPGSSWRNQPDTGPSIMRRDDPKIARGIGLAAAVAIIFGGMAMALQTAGRVTPLGIGWATFLLTVGIAGLLFHAAFDGDPQIRRVYMAFGYLCIIIGGFLAIVPYNKQPGALFGQGFVCLFLGLLFLLAFLRNEDDAWFRNLAENILGGAGAVMAIVGLAGGNIRGEFLLPYGLLLGLLGLAYVTAFILVRGLDNDLAYRAGLVLGGVGMLAFLIALGRSALPSLFYRFSWLSSPPPEYLVPTGLLLMFLGALYGLTSLALCSDNRLVVMTIRELGAQFYSPIAYIVLFAYVFAHWLAYWMYVGQLLDPLAPPVPEPMVKGFILQWTAVLFTIFIVPVLTMRLLSEEKRTATLEVLLTAPVDEGVVVVSKFLAAWIMFLFTWTPFLLFLLALRILGGQPFDYRPLFSFFTGLAVTGAGFMSMGVFFSSLTRNQIASGVLTFAGMLFLTLTFLLQGLFRESVWTGVLKHMSFIDVWFDTLDGKLVPTRLIFFGTMAIFWLFASVKVLEARKWT
jgi:ABC-2 type transport system permease protein